MPLLILIFVLLAAVILLLVALWPGRPSAALVAPFTGRNFAHRGLHSPDKSVPENSLAAFRLAAEAGYGIELDIQLSKDGQVVVFHDDTLDRVCGVKGRVDAYTLEQLQQMRLCKTEERIPLFTEVLCTVAGRVPLIVELKSGPRNEQLCRLGWELLKNYQGDFCIESFDPRIVGWFRKNVPQVLRGQLAQRPRSYNTLPAPMGLFLGWTLANFIGRPQFIAYQNRPRPLTVRLASLLGAVKVVWTVRDEADRPRVEGENEMVIFEFYRPVPKFKQ